MNSIILRTAAKYLLPLLLVFSVFMLLRGHYLPGGGFVGGLLAALAFVLHSFAYGMKETKTFMRFHPGVLIPLGLVACLIAAIMPFFIGQPVMTGVWLSQKVPVIGMVGSPLLFDVGVYFVVIGVALTVIFSIAEEI